MKKVLSLLLAVMLVVGLAPVVFAAAGDGPYKIGQSGTATPGVGGAYIINIADADGNGMNQAAIKAAKIDYRLNTQEGKKAIGSHSLKYDKDTKLAYIEVKMAKPYVSVTDVDYKFTVQLYVNKVEGDSVELSGTYGNAQVAVAKDTEYKSLVSGNQYLKMDGYCKNLEIEFDNDVFAYLNAFNGRKYYGYVTRDIKDADQELLSEYPDIESIYYVSHVGLSGAQFLLKNDVKMFVYDSELNYLGTTDEKLPFSDKYIVATSELDVDADIDDEPIDGDDGVDAGNPDMGGDDVPANINDNPGTGR